MTKLIKFKILNKKTKKIYYGIPEDMIYDLDDGIGFSIHDETDEWLFIGCEKEEVND